MRDGVPRAEGLIERVAFADLEMADLDGNNVTFWARGNRLLAEITLNDTAALAALAGLVCLLCLLEQGLGTWIVAGS